MSVPRTNVNNLRDLAFASGSDINVFKYFSAAQKADVQARGRTLDVSAALATALAAASAAGLDLYCPGGDYLCTGEVAANLSRITIRGDGENNTVFVTNSLTANIFNFGNGSTPCTDIYLYDVGFASTVVKTAGAFLLFNMIVQGAIEHFRMDKPFKGIEMVNTILVRARDGYITNVSPTTGMGVRVRGGNDQKFEDVEIANVPGSQCKCAVLIESTGATWLDNVGGLRTGIGLLLQPTTGGDVIEHLFTAFCAWDTCSSHGIMIDAPAGTTIRRCSSTQDWASTNDGHGVLTNGAGTIQNLFFEGFRAYNNGLHGLAFPKGADINVLGGTVAGNSRLSSGTSFGILFDTITGFSCGRVIIGAVGGFANSQGYGINITGACSKFNVSDNDVRNNVTAGIVSAVAITANEVIKDNIGYVSENSGVYASGAGNTDGSGDITVTHGLAATPVKVFPAALNLNGVYTIQVHTRGATTFKLRFFNVAAAGAALTAFNVGDIAWQASI